MSTQGADPGEEELIALSQEGHLDAFNRIVLCYQAQVYNLVARMVGDATAAEDITQEAFISAFRAIGGFRGGSLRAWLLRIAANAARDHLRRRRRRPEHSLEASGPGFRAIAPGDSPEAAALRAETARELERGIATLPPDQREVVLLVDVHGLSYEEAAETMGVSLGTVKSRLSRARSRLRDYLRERGELPPSQTRLK